MPGDDSRTGLRSLQPFDRHFELGSGTLAVIGSGEIGGKAHGLAMMQEIIDRDIASQFGPDIKVNIPTLAVIATEVLVKRLGVGFDEV